MNPLFQNPYRPGAGHPPPYLAGREPEIRDFERLLQQTRILENMILTGLRGVGKTVLLDTLKPIAMRNGWGWVGTDMSESSSVSEEKMAVRLLTDFSVVTAGLAAPTGKRDPGFLGKAQERSLNYEALLNLYHTIPGLPSDKLKGVLEAVWTALSPKPKGFIFAYDEAQNLSDHASKEEYPLSLLLEVFQSLQKKGFPFMLILTGLPTLFPKLVEARTFSERMFHIVTLNRLAEADSRDAILKPVEAAGRPIQFTEESVRTVIEASAGYPYFIQFICREVYDVFIQMIEDGAKPSVPIDSIIRKLDEDFFAGRWARVSDRQRDMLWVVAQVKAKDFEFTVQEVSDLSHQLLEKPFSPSHTNQMLSALSDKGLIFKNRYGKYSFAVPLLGDFILRQRPALASS